MQKLKIGLLQDNLLLIKFLSNILCYMVLILSGCSGWFNFFKSLLLCQVFVSVDNGLIWGVAVERKKLE